MGMFDEIRCAYPLPGTPPAYVTAGHKFQTKDLECELLTYDLTADGRLMLGGFPVSYDGPLDFYTTNVRASGPGIYTDAGEDMESVDYRAVFVGGRVREITETGRERHPALPYSALRQTKKPTEAEIEAWKARMAESLIGRTMFVLWGGHPIEKGYAAAVVAEGPREWVVRKPDGSFDTIHRALRDSILFDSEDAARKHQTNRQADWDRERAEYDALVAARAAGGG